ncbi:helix-turn-helix domain-containing protein [Streptomonospora nanhaiensis]|uniref:helix-turn-helix domain-containing protein n=1 Tax=Streptomonospora nanhaiensis TaxID=1323731 RepID=UPI001C9990A7|nr:pyridoxamine 5'-phosphate oxidase family protein [Streptomonospora nanhaiensis]MBX9390895.1 pyridoxamine 5'-phosphate oxidase family protein [Streptomonospora nanhaiensis]
MRGPNRPEGGDVGRRVARRRTELGLSREQLAERTGMDPGYVAYLEENPAEPSHEALYRLAQALRTSTECLLGAGGDTPPGSAVTAVPAPAGRVLGAEECRSLIAPGGVGRVAFTTAPGAPPTVLPVTYSFWRGAVVFRTEEGGLIARHAPGAMSFEVDRLDGATAEGWSVLVTGRGRPVADARELADLRADTDVRPWAGGRREAWIRVDEESITGRRVGDRRAPRPRAADTDADSETGTGAQAPGAGREAGGRTG